MNDPVNIQSRSNNNSLRYVPKQVIEVAKGMESEFSNFMLNEMNKTVQKNEENSSAMDYYQSLLTQKQSNILSNQNEGLGLQKLIIDQIYPEHLRTAENFKRFDQKNNIKHKQSIAKAKMLENKIDMHNKEPITMKEQADSGIKMRRGRINIKK